MEEWKPQPRRKAKLPGINSLVQRMEAESVLSFFFPPRALSLLQTLSSCLRLLHAGQRTASHLRIFTGRAQSMPLVLCSCCPSTWNALLRLLPAQLLVITAKPSSEVPCAGSPSGLNFLETPPTLLPATSHFATLTLQIIIDS